MKIGFNHEERVLWASQSGYQVQAEDKLPLRKEHLSCYVVNRDGEIISAFHPYESLYELEVTIKRHGLESFSLTTICEMYKPIFHGQLVKIYSAKDLIGICKIDDIQQKKGILTLKGSGLQQLIYDYKIVKFGASSATTSNISASKIVEGIIEEAIESLREEYRLLLPLELIDLPTTDLFPTFDIKEGSKVVDILELISDLLGGGCYYGFDEYGYFYFSSRQSTKYQYLTQEELTEYDISLDTTNIRNRVRAVISMQDGKKFNPSNYAEDLDSQARYGLYSEDIDMWFCSEEGDVTGGEESPTTDKLAQLLLVAKPQYSGNFSSQKFIDLFCPLVISGVYDETKREILSTLKSDKDFTIINSNNLKYEYQNSVYTLGNGAYRFQGSGTLKINLEERMVNMDYLIFNLSGTAQNQSIRIRLYTGKYDVGNENYDSSLDYYDHILYIADLPNHTRDYIIRDVDSVSWIEIDLVEANIIIDHIGYVHRVQDVSVIPESYNIKLTGDNFNVKVSVGREKSFSKIFKKMGKQARLQHQFLLGQNRNTTMPTAQFMQVQLTEEAIDTYTFVLRDRGLSNVDAQLTPYRRHGVYGEFIPYKEEDIVYVQLEDEKGTRFLNATSFTPLNGEYRYHTKPPLKGFLEMYRHDVNTKVTVGLRVTKNTITYHQAEALNKIMSQKQMLESTSLRTLPLHAVNLNYPLMEADLKNAIIRDEQGKILLPHEKYFIPCRYNQARSEWHYSRREENFYLDTRFSRLFPQEYQQYVGAFLNESVVEVISVEVQEQSSAGAKMIYKEHPAIESLEKLAKASKGYYLVPPGEDGESLILFPDRYKKSLVDKWGNEVPPMVIVKYKGSGSVLSIIDINQGCKPSWDDLPYEHILTDTSLEEFTLPTAARYFAVEYEAIQNPAPAPGREDARYYERVDPQDPKSDFKLDSQGNRILKKDYIGKDGKPFDRSRSIAARKEGIKDQAFNSNFGMGGTGGQGGDGGNATDDITLRIGGERIIVGSVAGFGGIGGAPGGGGGLEYYNMRFEDGKGFNRWNAAITLHTGPCQGSEFDQAVKSGVHPILHISSHYHVRGFGWSTTGAFDSYNKMVYYAQALSGHNGKSGAHGERGKGNRLNYTHFRTEVCDTKSFKNSTIKVEVQLIGKGSTGERGEIASMNGGSVWSGRKPLESLQRQASNGGDGGTGGDGGDGRKFQENPPIPLAYKEQRQDNSQTNITNNRRKTIIRWI